MSNLPQTLRQLKFPVIASPLFIISNPKLVIEQCKAGVIGSMPALNARPCVQRRHGANDARLALLDHQLGVADDEQRRGNHRKLELTQGLRQIGHGVS